jgi:hypothetical protein
LVDNRIIIDILKTKDQKLAAIRDKLNNSDNIAAAQAAHERWIEYEPYPLRCSSVGIDGSFNTKPMQGIDLYVVNAVAVDSANNILALEFDYDFAVTNPEGLKGLCLGYEVNVTEQLLLEASVSSIPKPADILLIDGSISARLTPSAASSSVRNSREQVLYDRETRNALIESIKRNNNNSNSFDNDGGPMTLLFVSKNSTSSKQFGSELSDMFCYNHLISGNYTPTPGFSAPFQNTEPFSQFGVTVIEVYARLRSFTPLIMIELVNTSGKILTQEELDFMAQFQFRRLLDKMVYHSVAGYPHCLRLAHDNCTITDDYIERLARIYGMNNEISARAPLHLENKKQKHYQHHEEAAA